MVVSYQTACWIHVRTLILCECAFNNKLFFLVISTTSRSELDDWGEKVHWLQPASNELKSETKEKKKVHCVYVHTYASNRTVSPAPADQRQQCGHLVSKKTNLRCIDASRQCKSSKGGETAAAAAAEAAPKPATSDSQSVLWEPVKCAELCCWKN